MNSQNRPVEVESGDDPRALSRVQELTQVTDRIQLQCRSSRSTKRRLPYQNNARANLAYWTKCRRLPDDFRRSATSVNASFFRIGFLGQRVGIAVTFLDCHAGRRDNAGNRATMTTVTSTLKKIISNRL